MDDFFRDLPWVECYPDDILVPGGTEEKQWAPVSEALRRLQAAGVRLSFGRRLVASSELPLLGLILFEDGLEISGEGEAVLETEQPKDLQLKRACPGLVNFCE